jgi:two-component system CheB/CheR fusion protein
MTEVHVARADVGERTRVMVVDDQIDCVMSVGRLLEALGYRVRVAVDGLGALACAAEFRPHVALLDLSLPHLDGFAVAERLRAMPETRETVLIAMSGWGTDDVRARIEGGAFDRLLQKPVSADTLAGVLGMVRST